MSQIPLIGHTSNIFNDDHNDADDDDHDNLLNDGKFAGRNTT